VVRGPHAQVTVDQEFVNLSATTLETEYVFPLPKGAMVSSLTLYENGRGLEGRILRAEEVDVLLKPAQEFFTGPNEWVVGRMRDVEESQEQDVIVTGAGSGEACENITPVSGIATSSSKLPVAAAIPGMIKPICAAYIGWRQQANTLVVANRPAPRARHSSLSAATMTTTPAMIKTHPT